MLRKFFIIYGPVLLLSGLSLTTLFSFGGGLEIFYRQVIWICVSLIVSIIISQIPLEFLKKNTSTIMLYVIGVGLLVLVLVIGTKVKGSQSWIKFGAFSFQPADIMKLFFIMILSKYLSRRHVEIAHVKHIFISMSTLIYKNILSQRCSWVYFLHIINFFLMSGY